MFYSKNHYQWKENDFKYETIIIFAVSAADTYYTYWKNNNWKIILIENKCWDSWQCTIRFFIIFIQWQKKRSIMLPID